VLNQHPHPEQDGSKNNGHQQGVEAFLGHEQGSESNESQSQAQTFGQSHGGDDGHDGIDGYRHRLGRSFSSRPRPEKSAPTSV